MLAIVSIVASVVSVMGGSYGYLMQERLGMTTASTSALLSGGSHWLMLNLKGSLPGCVGQTCTQTSMAS